MLFPRNGFLIHSPIVWVNARLGSPSSRPRIRSSSPSKPALHMAAFRVITYGRIEVITEDRRAGSLQPSFANTKMKSWYLHQLEEFRLALSISCLTSFPKNFLGIRPYLMAY